MRRAWTTGEIRALGVRTDLETAASIWGIGRTRAYELARTGDFPSPLVRVGAKWVALVGPLLRALDPDNSNSPTSAPSIALVQKGGAEHDPDHAA